MKVSVRDLSPTQKKLQVEIPAERVKPEIEKRYRELSRRVQLKGFRPGKVPRSVLQSYYGKSVESEVSNQFIQESYREALRESALKPLLEADVETYDFSPDGTFSYSALIEVCPPFQLEGYKGLEVAVTPAVVTEEAIEARLQEIREYHAELRQADEDQGAEEGLTAIIDTQATVAGVPYEKGSLRDYVIEVGKNTIHPEFDRHLLGQKVGETVEFEVSYPEQTPNQEIAGKRVRFSVTLKELKRRVLPELDDDFARLVDGVQSLEELRAKTRNALLEEREEQAKAEMHRQMIEQLIAKNPFELSAKVLDREVARLVGQLQHQFRSQGIPVDPARFDTPEIRAGYHPQAKRNVRWQLISERIIELEQMELLPEEREEIYEQAARMFRISKEKVKSDYAESQLVEQLEAGKLQDKVFALLDEHAVVTEAPMEAAETSQE